MKRLVLLLFLISGFFVIPFISAAENTQAAFISIDAGRLATDGKGDTEPVADNKTPESRAENRRVEFIRE